MTVTGRWATEQVGGHPCEVFQPDQTNQHGYVVVYLHDIHQARLADQPTFEQAFVQHGLPVVCPQTKRSWWCNRVCEEFDAARTAEQHVLEFVLPFVRQRWGSRPPQIALLGIGMGAQGALRFSYKFPDTFPIAAAISPAVDYQRRMEEPEEDEPLFDMYEDPEHCRQDTALLHIHPLNWPRHQFFCCDPRDARWADSADRLRMKLSSLGVPFEADLETSAAGQDVSYDNTMATKALAFIADALERERLRIL